MILYNKHLTVKCMHKDCHSLFRAVALSMKGQNSDFFAQADTWVTDSSINELRDFAATFLLIQAMSPQYQRGKNHLMNLSYASRTYVGVGNPSTLSWGNIWSILALAEFIKRPIVVLYDRTLYDLEDGENRAYSILYETKTVSPREVPVYLIARLSLWTREHTCYHFDLAEPVHKPEEYVAAYEQLVTTWISKQEYRNALLLGWRVMELSAVIQTSDEEFKKQFNAFEHALHILFEGAKQNELNDVDLKNWFDGFQNIGNTYYENQHNNFAQCAMDIIPYMNNLNAEFAAYLDLKDTEEATKRIQAAQQHILEEHAETEQAIQHVIDVVDEEIQKTYLEALSVNAVEQVNQNRAATQQWEGGNAQAPTYTPVRERQDLVDLVVNRIAATNKRQAMTKIQNIRRNEASLHSLWETYQPAINVDVKNQVKRQLENDLLVCATNNIDWHKDTWKIVKIFDTCLINVFKACKDARDSFINRRLGRIDVGNCTEVLHWQDIILCGTSTWDFAADNFMTICDNLNILQNPIFENFKCSKKTDMQFTTETDRERKTYLNLSSFTLFLDKNLKINIFPAKMIRKLRKKMMRQTVQVWVDGLLARFNPERNKNIYFEASISKRDLYYFLDPNAAKTAEVRQYALPELCIAIKDASGDDIDNRPELVAFRDKFFPDDQHNISKLCKLVFRLRYWCAFNRAVEANKDSKEELRRDLDGRILVPAADMQHGANELFVTPPSCVRNFSTNKFVV